MVQPPTHLTSTASYFRSKQPSTHIYLLAILQGASHAREPFLYFYSSCIFIFNQTQNHHHEPPKGSPRLRCTPAQRMHTSDSLRDSSPWKRVSPGCGARLHSACTGRRHRRCLSRWAAPPRCCGSPHNACWRVSPAAWPAAGPAVASALERAACVERAAVAWQAAGWLGHQWPSGVNRLRSAQGRVC